jgi:hypothetical protein
VCCESGKHGFESQRRGDPFAEPNLKVFKRLAAKLKKPFPRVFRYASLPILNAKEYGPTSAKGNGPIKCTEKVRAVDSKYQLFKRTSMSLLSVGMRN